MTKCISAIKQTTVLLYEEDGLRLANVPNVLLHNHWDIKVFGYCGGSYTKQCAKFKVNARSKPADYVYTEVEIKSWEALEKKCNKALEAAEKIEDDLKDYVKNTDYAANDSGKYGLVKLGTITNGLRLNAQGELVLYPALQTSLDNQVGGYLAITPERIAYAVKQSLINPNKSKQLPANWKDEERAAARATLGIENATESGNYGLIKIVGKGNGLEIQNDGRLSVRYARAEDLKNKTNTSVVTSYNISRAVKEGLIDPESGGVKGEWTDSDKQKAQNTLGFLTGEGAPTFTTKGYVGQLYTDTTTGTSYQCFAVGLFGEGNPNGVVTSDCQYQLYSDILNQKMYIAASKTDRTSWNNAPSAVPYNSQVYCWAEIFRTLAYDGYYNKSIRLNNIVGSGAGAGEEIDLGSTDRTIDFRIGGNFGFRMEGLANTGYVALKPFPSTSNGRLERTDLGTAEYPFRKLHLNDGVYVNGKSIVYTAPIEVGDDLDGKTIKFDTTQDINEIIETYPIGSSFFETDTYMVQRLDSDRICAFDIETGGMNEWYVVADNNGWHYSELILGGTVISVYNGGCPKFISKDVDCEHNYNEIAKLKAEIERLSSLLESKS